MFGVNTVYFNLSLILFYVLSDIFSVLDYLYFAFVSVLIVKFKSEVESKCKKDTLIKFEIKKVVRSPKKSMKPGMFFTLDAIKTNCPCLPMLKPGTYTLFGFYNEQRQLEISGALLKIVRG